MNSVKQSDYDSQPDVDVSLSRLAYEEKSASATDPDWNRGSELLANMQALTVDWRKPRYALPSLQYFSPFRTFLAVLYAVMVFSVLALASAQVWYGYASGEGLDVSSAEFIIPEVLYLVAAVGAAAELRRVMLRLGLRRKARRQTVIAEYDLDLTPVEAGVMLDAYSNDNEAAALLSSLQAKNAIRNVVQGVSTFVYVNGDQRGLTRDEVLFARYLFGPESSIDINELQKRLPEAAKYVRNSTFKRMMANGDLPVLGTGGKIVYFVLTPFKVVGFFIGAIMFTLLFNPGSYRINYPRYPVEAWQLSFIVILLAAMILIPLQAYFTAVFSKQGMEKYAEAAGLYMYIETVLAGHFGNGELSKSEEDKYLPYAQAFGLEPAYMDLVNEQVA